MPCSKSKTSTSRSTASHSRRPRPQVDAGRGRGHHGAERHGKSTLSYVIAGRDGYEVTEGEVCSTATTCSTSIPHERAAIGLFLAFQYPVEIPGVATMTFLKAALNAQRTARGEAELQTPDFMKRVREAAAQLGVDRRTC